MRFDNWATKSLSARTLTGCPIHVSGGTRVPAASSGRRLVMHVTESTATTTNKRSLMEDMEIGSPSKAFDSRVVQNAAYKVAEATISRIAISSGRVSNFPKQPHVGVPVATSDAAAQPRMKNNAEPQAEAHLGAMPVTSQPPIAASTSTMANTSTGRSPTRAMLSPPPAKILLDAATSSTAPNTRRTYLASCSVSTGRPNRRMEIRRRGSMKRRSNEDAANISLFPSPCQAFFVCRWVGTARRGLERFRTTTCRLLSPSFRTVPSSPSENRRI